MIRQMIFLNLGFDVRFHLLLIVDGRKRWVKLYIVKGGKTESLSRCLAHFQDAKLSRQWTVISVFNYQELFNLVGL